jgi:hypothetical protein
MVGKLNFAFGICILVFGVLSVIYGFNVKDILIIGKKRGREQTTT